MSGFNKPLCWFCEQYNRGQDKTTSLVASLRSTDEKYTLENDDASLHFE